MTDAGQPVPFFRRRTTRQTLGILLLCCAIGVLYGLANVDWGSVWLSLAPGKNRDAGNKTGPGTPPPLDPLQLNGENALEEARKCVELGPSVSGMEGAGKTADYLAKRLTDIGIKASIDEFADSISGGEVTFRNVIGTVPGKEKDLIILACHYDTKSGIATNFVGANDSCSGAGLLLEIGRLLCAAPRIPASVTLAFLDGEECRKEYSLADGLHGSRRMAKQLQSDGRAKNVKAVFVLDMIGDKDLTVTLPRSSTKELIAAILESAKQEGARDKFSLYEGDIVDDHMPFLRADMPAIDIIDFRYGSAPRKNDWWHTPQDTLDKLSADSLATVGRVVVRAVNKLMEKGGRPESQDR